MKDENYKGLCLYRGKLYSCGGKHADTDSYHLVEVGKPVLAMRSEFKRVSKMGSVRGEGSLYCTDDGQLFLREEGEGSTVIQMVLEEA
jgi:hypothetical protein